MEKEKIMLEKKESYVVEKLEYNNEQFNYVVTTTSNNNILARVDVAIYTAEKHEYVGTMSYGDKRFSANLNVLEDNIKHTEVFNEIYKLVSEEDMQSMEQEVKEVLGLGAIGALLTQLLANKEIVGAVFIIFLCCVCVLLMCLFDLFVGVRKAKRRGVILHLKTFIINK